HAARRRQARGLRLARRHLRAHRGGRAAGTRRPGHADARPPSGARFGDALLRPRSRAPSAPDRLASRHARARAPVRPMTLEAEVLHYADDASAKTSSMAEALASPDHFAEQAPLSTRSIWQVDHRRVFRGQSEWGERDAGSDAAADERR